MDDDHVGQRKTRVAEEIINKLINVYRHTGVLYKLTKYNIV